MNFFKCLLLLSAFFLLIIENGLAMKEEEDSLFNQHWPSSIQENMDIKTLKQIKDTYEKKLTTLDLSNQNIGNEYIKFLTLNPTVTSLSYSQKLVTKPMKGGFSLRR